jgi:enoyl-CoA hydratase
VNRVVATGELLSTASAMAAEIASKPPAAVRAILEAVSSGLDVPLVRGQQMESALFGLVADTTDAKEGTRAFLDKRAPRFGGQ